MVFVRIVLTVLAFLGYEVYVKGFTSFGVPQLGAYGGSWVVVVVLLVFIWKKRKKQGAKA